MLMVILVASYQAPAGGEEPEEVLPLQPGAPSSRPRPPLPMPFRAPLDPRGDVQLAWNVSYAQQEIYMELRVKDIQQGLVLGMSDRGQLTDADLVVLWSTGNQSYFGVSIITLCVFRSRYIILETVVKYFKLLLRKRSNKEIDLEGEIKGFWRYSRKDVSRYCNDINSQLEFHYIVVLMCYCEWTHYGTFFPMIRQFFLNKGSPNCSSRSPSCFQNH